MFKFRLLSIFFTTLALTGCSSGSGDDSEIVSVTSDTSSTERLNIAIINNGHMINMMSVAEAYTDQTGIALNWVTLNEDTLRNQVTSAPITDGSQYDVINIGMQEAPFWGAAGWIEPLIFSDEYDVEDVFPAMREGLSNSGTLHAAPFYGESSMLMYRSDLANSAAVLIDDNDSWRNVEAAAAAMHNPEEGVYGICLRGRPGWGDNIALLATIANSFGAVWFDKDNRPQLDSTQWNEATNFYVDILNNYGPPNPERNSFNENLTLFNDGSCGMWIDATIAASFIALDEVAYAQSPNGGNPIGANWLWAWAMAVPAGTPNTEEAMKFIEWATSKEYIQTVGNSPNFGWGSVPTGTRTSTYAIPEFQEVARFAAAEKIAIDTAAPSPTDAKPYLGVQFVSIPEFPEIGSALGQEIAAALIGSKSVEEALADAQETADQIMQDAGYY